MDQNMPKNALFLEKAVKIAAALPIGVWRLGICPRQGRRQKIFQGGANGKKTKNYRRKYRKIALFSLFQEGGRQRKKDRKIALLSLYLLYLYHV